MALRGCDSITNNHKMKKLEYSKITPYIFIGTNMCCQTHFDDGLIGKGVEADISLEYEHMDRPWEIKYFLWIPTKNHTAPSTKLLKLGANALKQLVDSKIKAYVHCEHGHGRAPTLVAAYFILTGKTREEAIDLIRRKRPSIHLEKVQIEALKKIERWVKNGKI